MRTQDYMHVLSNSAIEDLDKAARKKEIDELIANPGINPVEYLSKEDAEDYDAGHYMLFPFKTLLNETPKAWQFRFYDLVDGKGVWFDVLRDFMIGGISGRVSKGLQVSPGDHVVLVRGYGKDAQEKPTGAHTRVNWWEIAYRDKFIYPHIEPNSLDSPPERRIWLAKSKVMMESFGSESSGIWGILYIPVWIVQADKLRNSICG